MFQQIINEIEPHEIYFYEFENEFLFNQFYFHSIQGQSLLYGYFTTNNAIFTIKEEDITKKYLALGFFATPKIFQKFYNLRLTTIYDDDKDEYHQRWILLVYCLEDKIKCKYSLSFCPLDMSGIDLLENTPISFYNQNQIFSEGFIIDLRNQEYNSTISIYYTAFSGNLDMTIINNNQEIVPYVKMLSTKAKIVYECGLNCLLYIKINILEPYYFTLYYKVNETVLNEQIIQKGIVDINDISFNQNITLILQEEAFVDDVMILVYIKTQDCTINLNGLTEDITVDAYDNNFYQLSFIEKKEYKFYISLDKFDDENNLNPNDTCVYYTYAAENDNTESIVITEGVEYKNRFTANQTIINYEFPFLFYNESNTFIIDVQLSELITIYTIILFENSQTSLRTETMNNNCSFYFPYNFYFQYCIPNEICKVKIQIISFGVGGYSTIKIKAKSKNLIYIPKNTIITDMIHNQFLRYFYTNVKNGDRGIIQFLYKYRGLVAFYKVYEKSEIKTNLLFTDDNWIGVSDYFTGKLQYSIDLPCMNGCILVIRVESPSYLNQVLTEFSIFVSDTKKPITSPLNEKIKGYFDSINTKYSFIFTLPQEMKTFQIFTKGEFTQYEIRDLNDNNPCCVGINHKYEQGREPNFDNYEIDIDTSNYNIVIEITAISPESFDPLLSFYEIIVNPTSSDNAIHKINSNTEIECHTGKDNNFGAFMLYLVMYEQYDEIIIYVDSPQLEIKNFTIISMDIEEDLYNNLPPKQEWNSIFKTSEIYTSLDGESFLRIPYSSEYKNEQIYVLAPFNDARINLQVKKISFSGVQYLIPNESNLIHLNPNSASEIILLNNYHPLFTDKYLYFLELEEIIGKGKIYINNNTFFVKGKQIISLDHSTFDFNKQLSITVQTFNEEFLVKIKFCISKKEDYNLQTFKIYNLTQFKISSDLFPFYLYSYLDDSVNLSFNVKLLYNDKNHYDFSNLEIKGYLTNKESILSFKKNNTLNKFEQINAVSIDERQVILLDYDKSISMHSSYDYLFLQINEKKEKEKNQLNFQIISDTRISNDQTIISIVPMKYIYGKITPMNNNNKIQYILDLGVRQPEIQKKVKVEFASSIKDGFNISFNYYTSKEQILPDESINEYGKISYTLLIEEIERFISLTIFIPSLSSTKDVYYMLKYSVIDKDKEFPQYKISKKLSYHYHPFNKTIQSVWGNITNSSNYDSVVNAHFFYYLFEKGTKEGYSNSICVINPPIKPIYTSNLSINWQNDSISSDGYINRVIGYFIDSNEEEFIISFEEVNIAISSGNILLWVIIIVVVIGVIIFFGTFRLYKEVTKREKEENNEIPPALEIN